MRRGNLADFEATNMILASGEPCYVIDNNRFVIGDGQTPFIDLPILNAEVAEQVKLNVKNTSGNTLSKGTPVYVTGTVGATDVLEISAADASDPLTMPAVGLLEEDLDNNGIGHIVVGGLLKHIATDPIDGATPSESDVLYVKAGGGLTTTKPTGVSNLIQNVGKVGKVSGGNSGSIIVSSIMRTNDVPNAISCESLTVAGVPITGSSGGGFTPTYVKYDYATTSTNIVGNDYVLGDPSSGGSYTASNDGGLSSSISVNSEGEFSGFVENGIYRFDGSFYIKRDSNSVSINQDFYFDLDYYSGGSFNNVLDEYYISLPPAASIDPNGVGDTIHRITAKVNGVFKFVEADSNNRKIRLSQNPDITSTFFPEYGYFTITRIA